MSAYGDKRESVLESALNTSSTKMSEKVTNAALIALGTLVKKKFGEATVLLGTAFTRYLDNATYRYNHVRTLATGHEPRTIIGNDSIYINVGIRHRQKKIDTSSISSLRAISDNLLIVGTGGIGKSMLMRYLFLRTAFDEEYIPVLLELRRISDQEPNRISIEELIYSCMEAFDVSLPKDQFKYSLRLGKYVFLFDGFDEIKESTANQVASKLQEFSSKYPNNVYIITSRLSDHIKSFETFTLVESMPLNKEEAVELASRIWKEDEKTKEFCYQLKDNLYDTHKDFAENPLLLTMMFLTFMRNNSVPNHLASFYSKAYDALYSIHDSNDKGYYRRDFRCKSLDEQQFKLVFAHFCFQSYFREDYEFNHEDILSYFDNAFKKLKIIGVNSNDYLEDIRNIVCMLIKDGDIFRFSHRSFQSYFAAYYTSSILTDEQQIRLFESALKSSSFSTKKDYYKLLAQIEHERFLINALEIRMREIVKYMDTCDSPQISLMKRIYKSIAFEEQSDSPNSGFSSRITDDTEEYYDFNIVALFRYIEIPSLTEDEAAEKRVLELINRIGEPRGGMKEIDFDDLDECTEITENERLSIYTDICKLLGIPQIYDAVCKWLSNIDAKRKVLSTNDFIDDL